MKPLFCQSGNSRELLANREYCHTSSGPWQQRGEGSESEVQRRLFGGSEMRALSNRVFKSRTTTLITIFDIAAC